ncbi:LuxR C-terminal-related transcriptional regulator [Parapedobacter koreensis]|uniref:Two component transcriptional regulator, LuxR family n=1 Tax=Parapedobacter koreensis TaxID=332977 RepID=A0A1H7M210_9SPHI|nr:response regulator transcription factor [Parapedobacter koreensis]SEL05129.1 two component transcriptional regulator, LuxR family [Parapedobacter koreensis]
MASSLTNVGRNIFLTYCHEIVGIAMKWLVQQHFPFSAIGEAQNFQETLSDLPKKQYDLVVLDAEIGGGAHVLGTVEHIKSISPKTRILIFSELDETIYGPKYLAFGINGYLTKNADVDSIVQAIEAALNGEIFQGENDFSAAAQQQEPLKWSPFGLLSNREAQIADLLIKGVPLIEISKRMNLKETTISTYKKRVFKKTNVKAIADLISLWQRYK